MEGIDSFPPATSGKKWVYELLIAGSTWTPPPGCYLVLCKRIQAAGGASGSKGTNSTEVPGGGGAGECLFDMPLPCTPGVDLTITGLGTAGVAAASGNNDGGDGPNVSISNGTITWTARGGKGGKRGSTRTGGDSGAGSVVPGGAAGAVGTSARESQRATTGGAGGGGPALTNNAGPKGGACAQFDGGLGGSTDGTRSGGAGGGASAFGKGADGGSPSGGTTGAGNSPAADAYGAGAGGPSGGTAAAAGKDGIKGAIELLYEMDA